MKPLRTNPLSQRFDPLWLALITVVITVIMFLSGLWGSDGHLAAPLDDTFIHFQYARQLATGHPFEYNTGDPPSSGDSAFIYPFMLAPAYLVGLNGMKTLFYADALNLAAHLIMVLLMYSLAFRLGGRRLALFASAFVLLDGSLNWIFLSGMETGIYAAGLVAFFWFWLRDAPSGRYYWMALVGTLIALLRPEGHILISVVCVATLAYIWRKRGFAVQYAWLLLPVFAGILPYIVNEFMTGSLQFNTAASKSIWYVPYSPLREKLSLTIGYGINELKQTYLGLEVGRSPYPLMAAPVVVLGMFVALRRRFRGTKAKGFVNHVRVYGQNTGQTDRKFLHVLMIFTLLGGIGLALLLPPLHFNRYYMPYNAFVWLYLAIGLLALIKPLSKRFLRRTSRITYHASHFSAPLFAFAAVVLLCLPQFLGYFFAFGDSVRDIYYQQMTFTEWVRRYTPTDTRIAVNDTGAHKYLSDRYVLDLIGLTSNNMQGAYFSGWGTIYDRLLKMPEAERPTLMLVHPNVFVNGLDESVSQSFLKPMYSIRVQNPIITAGDTEVLYKIDWSAALLDEQITYLIHKGEKPLDILNVGDLGDEQHHAYSEAGRQPSIAEPKSIVATAPYSEQQFTLTESGRRHSGWEEFITTSIAGKPLTVVMRTRLASDANQTVLISANGREVGLWKMQNDQEGNWQEYEYTIPANFITSAQTTLHMDTTYDPGGGGFSDYRYWFYAP